MAYIPDNRDIGSYHFIYRGWINIDMRFERARAERIQAPRDPIIKARPDIDH